jgi:DNA polymerase III epsilon subunit-like protein
MFPSTLISTRHCPVTATDVETTGFTAGYHEICEVAFVVLDSDLNITDDHFYSRIRPQHPKRCDPEAMRVHGISLDELNKWPTEPIVLDMFDAWFDKLVLPLNKKLTPLAHNWSMECKFYDAWMGEELMRKYFSLPRDTLRVAAWMNDRACFQSTALPFPDNCKLGQVCERLGVPYEGTHNALDDSIACAKAYKQLLRRG